MEREKVQVITEENGSGIYMTNDDFADFQVRLSTAEKIKCLEEIIRRFKKILYVYDRSQEPETKYNYKVFCGGILIYVSSSNLLFEGELVNVVVNLNAIINNDFDKPQLKRIVFESKNQLDYLLEKYKSGLVEAKDTEDYLEFNHKRNQINSKWIDGIHENDEQKINQASTEMTALERQYFSRKGREQNGSD